MVDNPLLALLSANKDPLDEYGKIEHSLKFDSASSQYLSWTPSVAGDRRTWEFYTAVKRADLGADQALLASAVGASDATHTSIRFNASDQLIVAGWSGTYFVSNAVFRNPLAHLFIKVRLDTTQATSTERLRIWVNGDELTGTFNYPAQNAELGIHYPQEHSIGRNNYGGGGAYFGGYLSDTLLTSGVTFDVTDNGLTHPTTRQWRPKPYTGSYGTNGFHLDFADANFLGKDVKTELGSELVANGTFDADVSNWTVSSAGITYSGGRARTSTQGAKSYQYISGLDSSKTYQVSVRLETEAASYVILDVGTTAGNLDVARLAILGEKASKRLTTTFTDQTAVYVEMETSTIPSGYVYWDDISIKEVITGGNDWNSVNITTADQTIDTPTNNFCTFNPLNQLGASFAEGNLKVTHSAATSGSLATMPLPETGITEWEVRVDQIGASCGIGIIAESDANYNGLSQGGGYGQTSTSHVYRENGNYRTAAAYTAYGASYTTGDRIHVRYDADAGELSFKKDGVDQGVAVTGLSGKYFPVFGASVGTANILTVNFGQTDLTDLSADAKTLCTKNLPMPTGAAEKPWEHFDVVTRIGTSVEVDVTGIEFPVGFIWTKRRSAAELHCLIDEVRGVTSQLDTSSTLYELTRTDQLQSFNPDGYTYGADMAGFTNVNGQSYVDWLWKAGGAPVTNNDGSISSQVSANPEAGFSIVGYTEPSGTFSFGHGLPKAPSLIIIKATTIAENWVVWTPDIATVPTATATYLNQTLGTSTAGYNWLTTVDSSVMEIVSGAFTSTGSDKIVYCFTDDFFKIGTYTGNGSTDGTYVHCGFQPRFVLVKRTDAAGNWVIYDSERDTNNVVGARLFPNSSAAESDAANVDFLAAGFKFRATDSDYNASGSTYIYLAIPEFPFRYANAR